MHDAIYLVAKKELSDRNWQRQKHKNLPNIPQGTKFLLYPHQVPKFKFVCLIYNSNRYEVNVNDLELIESCYYGYKDGENHVL